MASINEITQGYSRSGAEAYLNDLNAKAITETKELLGKISGITDALEAGWAGKSQERFIANLQSAVKVVQDSLDTCKQSLEAQLADTESAWEEFDKSVVDEWNGF